VHRMVRFFFLNLSCPCISSLNDLTRSLHAPLLSQPDLPLRPANKTVQVMEPRRFLALSVTRMYSNLPLHMFESILSIDSISHAQQMRIQDTRRCFGVRLKPPRR
jgi:hypothetical protein